MKFLVVAWMLALPILFLPGYSTAGDLAFLSFDNEEMISFNLSLKQYMASFKGEYMEKEKGFKSIVGAVSKLEVMIGKAKKQTTDVAVLGRLCTIKGLLLQAKGLAAQGRLDESNEISVPIRTELYELHRAIGMLTEEDYMIFFHNGVLHRAEPLVAEGRYLELQMMIPALEGTVAKFKNPPKSVTNVEQYSKRYGMLVKMVKAYTTTIREMTAYVDPQYGALMLTTKIEDAHTMANKKFGALYLSFPEGMVWPKGSEPKIKK